MININTLRVLNNLGIGSDVNKLESYIIDFKQAQLMAETSIYKFNYFKLQRLLREMKNDSLAFTDKTSLDEIKKDKYDKFLELIPSYNMNIAFGIDSKSVDTMKENINSNYNSCTDIMALPKINGININCVYINGYIYRIYAIGGTYKYIDLSKLLKDKVPGYIDALKDIQLTEFRGVATIKNEHKELQTKSLNTVCSTMRCIRTNTDIDKISIILNDMFIDTDENTYFSNQWDKLEYMRDLGLSVPHHGLIRGVDKDILTQALVELDDYFINIACNEGISYDYTGIEVRLNDDILCNNEESKLLYISNYCDSTQVYKSTIKSVYNKTIGNIIVPVLNIVPIDCNDKLSISSIEITDILDIEELGLSIGQKVYFSVIEDKAIIYKNNNIK